VFYSETVYFAEIFFFILKCMKNYLHFSEPFFRMASILYSDNSMHFSRFPSILVVGAGHCGGRTVQALREFGWQGPIDLVGDEPGLPYERPPLSKDVLTGAKAHDTLDLMTAEAMHALNVQHHRARMVALEPQEQLATLSDGSNLHYGAMLFANGGAPRSLAIPGADLRGVLTLRSKADALLLAPTLRAGQRIVIIGGGFIGLEVASSARKLGCAVSLVEGAPQLMGRAVPKLLADRAQALHVARGVDIHLGVSPLHIARNSTGLEVALSDGARLQADVVLIGIGIQAGIDVAQAAGIAVARGILVNRQLQTSVPHVYAAGDVAEFPSHMTGALLRQETWQNAESQARVAAHNLMGGSVDFNAHSWFWSDQYDYQLQVSGEPAAGVQTIVREQEDGDVLVFYTDAHHKIVGACGWGLTSRLAKDMKLARTLVERGISASAETLADPDTKLKALLKA
jgi:3-phenylpropionate/trans-cinnamate dioxygenase ferredoxin reductase component